MRSRKTMLMLLALASGIYACATVADLDVTPGPGNGPTTVQKDDDDSGLVEGDAAIDRSTALIDAGTTPDAPPPPPVVCSCPAEQACCVPGSGPGVCAPATGNDACRMSGGIFLRCSGPDIANGRLCCFTADGLGTTYAAACPDAGPEICSSSAECTTGTCRMFACRGAMVGFCGEPADPMPTCP